MFGFELAENLNTYYATLPSILIVEQMPHDLVEESMGRVSSTNQNKYARYIKQAY